MKRLSFILVLMLAASIGAMAQEADWVEITALHAAATGNTDKEHALKQYLLISDEEQENHEELMEEYKTFVEEYVQMDINQEAPQVVDDISKTIAELEKSHPELAAQMRAELAKAQEEIKNYTDPSVTSFTSNPADLLKRLTAIAVNRKPYSGHSDIGNGLFAVTEAPRYGPIEDDAFTKIQVADDDKYGWGAITPEGKTVIPQQYCLLTPYFISPDDDFIVLASKGKDGKRFYGAYSYSGSIKIPFVLDDVTIVSTIENLIVGIKDGKYGSMDLNGNILVPFEYVAWEKCGGAWPVSRDGKNFGIVTQHGKEVVPFKYRSFWNAGPDYISMERFDGKVDVFSFQDFRLLRTEDPEN